MSEVELLGNQFGLLLRDHVWTIISQSSLCGCLLDARNFFLLLLKCDQSRKKIKVLLLSSFFFFFFFLEGKIPIDFEKYKHCHEVASDYSFCGSQGLSSAASGTFTTAYEEERNTEIPSASGVCLSELHKPVSLENLLYASLSFSCTDVAQCYQLCCIKKSSLFGVDSFSKVTVVTFSDNYM